MLVPNKNKLRRERKPPGRAGRGACGGLGRIVADRNGAEFASPAGKCQEIKGGEGQITQLKRFAWAGTPVRW